MSIIIKYGTTARDIAEQIMEQSGEAHAAGNIPKMREVMENGIETLSKYFPDDPITLQWFEGIDEIVENRNT